MEASVVCDLGSVRTAVGWAGEDIPSLFVTRVGRARYPGVPGIAVESRSVGGENDNSASGLYDWTYPIDHRASSGIDFEALEQVVDHAFSKELRVGNDIPPFCFGEHMRCSDTQRARMLEILFESLNVPHVSSVLQPIAPLYASGRGHGIVLDCGEGYCQIMPVLEGCTFRRGQQTLALAGCDVTLKVATVAGQLLRGGSPSLLEMRQIKEKVCFVARDSDDEVKRYESSDCHRSFKLPDGAELRVEREAFLAGECLFQPRKLLGRDIPGIQEMLAHAVRQCDASDHEQQHRHLWRNHTPRRLSAATDDRGERADAALNASQPCRLARATVFDVDRPEHHRVYHGVPRHLAESRGIR